MACARREHNGRFRHEVYIRMLPPFRVNPEIERNHVAESSGRLPQRNRCAVESGETAAKNEMVRIMAANRLCRDSEIALCGEVEKRRLEFLLPRERLILPLSARTVVRGVVLFIRPAPPHPLAPHAGPPDLVHAKKQLGAS